jgi:hypothetical protein
MTCLRVRVQDSKVAAQEFTLVQEITLSIDFDDVPLAESSIYVGQMRLEAKIGAFALIDCGLTIWFYLKRAERLLNALSGIREKQVNKVGWVLAVFEVVLADFEFDLFDKFRVDGTLAVCEKVRPFDVADEIVAVRVDFETEELQVRVERLGRGELDACEVGAFLFETGEYLIEIHI